MDLLKDWFVFRRQHPALCSVADIRGDREGLSTLPKRVALKADPPGAFESEIHRTY
jgi:hypothetical protein